MTYIPAAEHDFDFKASDPGAAKTLTPDQVRFWNENGYLSQLRIGDAQEAELRREYFEHLFELMKAEDDGRDNYGLLGYHTRCGGLWDLIHDARILDIVEDLIGPNIICWSTQYFNKIPKDPKAVPLHQDASYWPFTPQTTVTCWLAIDPSTVENACLQVLPKSHLHGQLEWETTQGEHAMAGTKDALSQSVVNPERFGKLASLELEPGEMSIHSDKTVHGSEPNRSDKRRCGFAMRYCTPEMKPTDPEFGLNAVLCRGVDPHGHFQLSTERPEGDDIMSWRNYLMLKFIEQRRNAKKD